MSVEIVNLKRLRATRQHLSIRQMADLLGLKLSTVKGWFSGKHVKKDTLQTAFPEIVAATEALCNVVETLADKGFDPDRLSAWFGKQNPHIPGQQRPRSAFKNGHFAEVQAAAEKESELVAAQAV